MDIEKIVSEYTANLETAANRVNDIKLAMAAPDANHLELASELILADKHHQELVNKGEKINEMREAHEAKVAVKRELVAALNATGSKLGKAVAGGKADGYIIRYNGEDGGYTIELPAVKVANTASNGTRTNDRNNAMVTVRVGGKQTRPMGLKEFHQSFWASDVCNPANIKANGMAYLGDDGKECVGTNQLAPTSIAVLVATIERVMGAEVVVDESAGVTGTWRGEIKGVGKVSKTTGFNRGSFADRLAVARNEQGGKEITQREYDWAGALESIASYWVTVS